MEPSHKDNWFIGFLPMFLYDFLRHVALIISKNKKEKFWRRKEVIAQE